MNILFYIPASSGAQDRIQDVVETVASTAKVEVYQSMKTFAGRLSRPAVEPVAAVLVIGGREDLFEMGSIRTLLIETPLILILPDRKKSTTAMGFRFYPRFITYADGDLKEVEAVLQKCSITITKINIEACCAK